MIVVNLKINGRLMTTEIEPRETLLDTLRDKFDLTGAKKGCNEGVCGACTVLLDGKAVCSCNMFAIEAQNSEITTIEGLDVERDPVQKAFIEADALQCGYCTPGQILSARSFLSQLGPEDLETINEVMIKDALSGNLCRCGCYNNIVKAITKASRVI